MLLTRQRTSLIYLCLAGMEAAWFTPICLLMYRVPVPLWLGYCGVLATLLAWTAALELLDRAGLETPAFDAVALGLMAVTTLLIAVPPLIATRLPLTQAFSAVFAFTTGFPPTLALMAGNLFLWQRATAATSREISFFGVGVSFRTGLLLLIAIAGIVSGLVNQDFTPLLWVYLTAGLLSVAIARVHEKASGAQSVGRPLPVRRFMQLVAATAMTIGGAGLAASLSTPERAHRVLAWLTPLWQAVNYILLVLLWLAGLVLNPFLEWLVQELARLYHDVQPNTIPLIQPMQPRNNPQDTFAGLPPWVKSVLSNIGLGVVIVIATLLIMALLLLYLEKARREAARNDSEAESLEAPSFGSGILGRGLAALRRAARLARRYGLGRGLLAVVSVQNIYANLCRLARRRGYGRQAAQPPDVYLPTLAQAFPGHEDALGRITAAYMRVHYGDRPLTYAELTQVKADYALIRHETEQRRIDMPAGPE